MRVWPTGVRMDHRDHIKSRDCIRQLVVGVSMRLWPPGIKHRDHRYLETVLYTTADVGAIENPHSWKRRKLHI
jgi:hypothetical protein